MTLQQRYDKILQWFALNRPEAESELNFQSSFQLLVAVILSAQCTDKRVNLVTPNLFARFPDALSMSKASADEILPFISSISYPNSKAAHLADMSRHLVSRFDGQVPSDFDSLTSLPGVGRKTANVMLAVAFGGNAMPVDTHVFRVANRLGLCRTSTPLATERALVRHIPAPMLSRAHHWLLLHGRYTCTARSPKCSSCGLSDSCDFFRKHARR
ncbi:MAG: endonuclease III [Paludibacteraceae bacterium]|nr:endonuclease III [Paludibacteraceae bacterium]